MRRKLGDAHEQLAALAEEGELWTVADLRNSRAESDALFLSLEGQWQVHAPVEQLDATATAGTGGGILTVRRETGKEYGVKVSDDKDLASHIDPKPCGGVREDVGEASVGACAGRKLSLVNTFRAPTPWSMRKAT